MHILLSGIEDNTVKQWHVHPELKLNQTYKKLPIYSVFWGNTLPKLAIANTGDQIQILNEDKIRIETEKTNNPIKKIAFSLCGTKLIYGLENGDIIEFNLETKCYKKLMTLHGSIKVLKYLNEDLSLMKIGGEQFYNQNSNNGISNLIIASADNGCLMVYFNNYALQLRSPQTPDVTPLRRLPVVPIIECFYLSKIDRLLTVAENRSIKIWIVLKGTHEVLNGDMLYNETHCNVTMAIMSNDQKMLAVTMTDSTFEIYNLDDTLDYVKTILYWNTSVDCPLRCCAFSYDNKYFAVGGDNGNITVSIANYVFPLSLGFKDPIQLETRLPVVYYHL